MADATATDRKAGRQGSVTSMWTFLRPRWLLWHVVVWASVVGMIELGQWQLRVSNDRHFDLQNYSYFVQWYAFAACAVWFWVRSMRNALRPPRVTVAGNAVVVRRGSRLEVERGVHVGPVSVVAPSRLPGGAPAVYQAYIAPNSATAPASSDGDLQHGAYNDFLWELALKDHQRGADPTAYPEPAAPDLSGLELGPMEPRPSLD